MKEVRLFLATLMQKGVRLYLDQGNLKSQAPKGAIEANERDYIKANKDSIIAYLQTLTASGESAKHNVITKQSKTCAPLSFAQQRLWFIENLQGTSAEYNMPIAFSVAGQLDSRLVESVLTSIIERHEVLRTIYVEQAGETQQLVRPMSEVNFSIDSQDLSHLTREMLDAEVETLIAHDATKAFDLGLDLMVRVSYIKTAQDAGVLVFNMHHIASDGWSIEVLTKEFFTLYQAYAQGLPNPLPPLAIQYSDYALWQREPAFAEGLSRQFDYWQKQLDELPQIHGLPLDFPRPALKQSQGAIVAGELPKATAQGLLALAKRYQLTPFMLLHGALSLLIAKHSNSHDIVVGTPVANRMQSALQPLIGFFVNTQVLRVDTAKADLAEYLAHVRQVHLEAQANQDVPFEQLVERVKVPRSTAHTPLFQIMLSINSDYGVDNTGLDAFSLSDAQLRLYPAPLIQSKFDLDIELNLSEHGLGLKWNYDVSLFTQAHIVQLNDHLCRLLDSLVNTMDQQAPTVDGLTLLSDDETAHLLYGLNETDMAYPKDKCIHQLFEQQAARYPEHTALIFDGHKLSFSELNDKANQLAHYLKEHCGVSPDTLVGLCVERSLEMVIAMLAILKAGGAYVPLDPKYPQDRLNYMLADAELKVVLSQAGVKGALGQYQGMVLELDGLAQTDDAHAFSHYPKFNLAAEDFGLTPTALAYVIYTSGSTGKPKGVLVEHRSVCNLVVAQQASYQLAEAGNEVGILLASFAFDAAVEQIFTLLLSGNALVIVRADDVLQPQVITDLIDEHQVTHIDSTPSHLMSIAQCLSCQSLKRVASGGEAMLPQLRDMLNPEMPLYNVYGPTETCVTSSVASDSESVGRPIGNTQFYLLDTAQHLVPYGAAGELYIGGDGLARGYLNLDAMTAERFIDNPFYRQGRGGSRKIYRTGDLMRYLPDGRLAFLGRVDDQVKVRGYRIELGEVETQLGQLEGVDSAVVMAQNIAGLAQLVGYVKPLTAVAEDKIGDYAAEVKATLAQTLPQYMVPSVIMVIAQWPLTPSGKIDKKALPSAEGSDLAGEFVAPSTPSQQLLAEIWAGLLNIASDSVSAKANFFDLGGHSLLSIRLVSEIRERSEVEISVQNIFERPVLEDMAQLLEQGVKGQTRPPLQALSRQSDQQPVSFAQQRLWFIDSLQGGSSEYNMPMAFEITGQLDTDLVTKVFYTIVERHEILRTVYLQHQGQTLQRIRPMAEIGFEVNVEDLSHLTGETLDKQVQQLVEQDVTGRFDLANDLMLRVSYIKTATERGVLIFNMHHIASDGWSMDVLSKEFFSLFSAYSQGQANPLAPLSVQYADFAQWQRDYLDSGVMASQLAYWAEQLDDLPALHSLPLDYPRPLVKQHQGAIVAGQLPKTTAEQLMAVAKEHNITPFMLLHGALSLLLARHANSHDIVIGTPVANRLHSELEPLIGFFVNTLVLRVDTDQASLGDYFAHVKQVHLAAQSHQDVPFEQLVERLKAPRSQAHSPLFQIMLTTDTDYGVEGDNALGGFDLGEVQCRAYRSGLIQSKFDLEIEMSLNAQGVSLRWNYDTSLFSAAHITQLNDHLCRLLEGLANAMGQGDMSAHGIEILSSAELNRLVFDLNQTEAGYDNTACIHQLFERQAERNPAKTAVVFEGQSLSYGELNQQANRLAHYLRDEHGVGPDTLVGLCLERSIEMVIGIFAILKAGGAYVPLDPTYPQDRLNYMLGDAAMAVVLSQGHLQQQLSEYQGNVLTIDGLAVGECQWCDHCDSTNPTTQQTGLTANHLAYVIYTSGSTGQPKGVMVEHQALYNRIHWMHKKYGMDEQDKVLQKTPFSFDVSVWEFVWTLAYGVQLHVAKPEGHKDPDYLCQLIEQNGITKLHFVPSMLGLILECERFKHCVSLKQVFCSGEALQVSHVEGFKAALPNAQLHNLYGPTEAAIDVSFWDCAGDVGSGVPIGRPIDNIQLMILDRHLNMVPEGAVGELHIGGDGLARGYLNRDELTKERFIANPFYDPAKLNSSPRLYKTGDLARLRSDGEIEYQGRTDHQVKIRGLRIELGEVETQLAKLAAVDSALVTAQEVAGALQLVAYVKAVEAVAQTDSADYVAQVKEALAHTLPQYMIPSIIMVLELWPLTPNGKVDRKALPTPMSSALLGEYVAPKSEIELTLAAILAELLEIEQHRISTSANFFDLGASSIMLIKVLHQLQEAFEVNISVEKLYQHQTIASLGCFIEEENAIQKMTEIEEEESQWEI